MKNKKLLESDVERAIGKSVGSGITGRVMAQFHEKFLRGEPVTIAEIMTAVRQEVGPNLSAEIQENLMGVAS